MSMLNSTMKRCFHEPDFKEGSVPRLVTEGDVAHYETSKHVSGYAAHTLVSTHSYSPSFR